MKIYVNGALSGSGGAPGAGPLASSIPVSIGAGEGGITPTYDMYFDGSIDEVAIYNTQLSDAQVLAHYCAQFGSGVAPLIGAEPAGPIINWVGWPIAFQTTVAGSCTLTYQWFHNNVALSDGATIT